MLNNIQLDYLKSEFTSHPHEAIASTGREDEDLITNWTDRGSPHSWVEVEKSGRYTVFADVGYGWLVIFKDDSYLGRGMREITGIDAEIVVLDKEYYRVSKYIWK